jgi:hypothetical protein
MCPGHRNQTISRKGANIISRRPSHGHLARWCCPQAFLRIFSEVTYEYIRTVGNSTLLKIYTLPNHTITIGVCILEIQLLGLLYGGGASFVQKWPCRGCLLLYRSLFYIVWFLWSRVCRVGLVVSSNSSYAGFVVSRVCCVQNLSFPGFVPQGLSKSRYRFTLSCIKLQNFV